MSRIKLTKRTVVKWSAFAVLAVGLLYLIAGNVALNANFLGPMMNKKPEKMLVEWDSGWTIFPGKVHLKGLRLRGQTRRQQWETRLETAAVSFSPLALFDKTVRVSRARGSGFQLRLRKRLTPEEANLEWAQHFPEIEGLSNPPDPAPEKLYPAKKKKKRWFIDVTGLRLNGPVEVWLGRMRIAGHGEVGGGIVYQIGEDLEVPGGILDLEDGELTFDGDVLARGFRSDIDIRLTPYNPKQIKGVDVLGQIFGNILLEDGELPDLRVLNGFLPPEGGIELTGGTGQVRIQASRALSEEAGRAQDHFSVDDAQLLLAGEELSGSLALHAELRGGLAQGFYEIQDTTLALEDVVMPGGEQDAGKEETAGDPEAHDDSGWWGRFTVKEGNVLLKKPMDLDVVADLELKSTDPLLHLFFSKPRKNDEGKEGKPPAWVKFVPNIHNLSGWGSIDIDESGLLLDDMVIQGDELDVMARLKGRKGDMDGQMYLRYKLLHIGVDVNGGRKNLKFIKPLKWFMDQPELDDTTSLEALTLPDEVKDGGR